jgi:hypothetical protein
MKKTIIFLLILISTPIIAGLYGIIHDEFTYTISNEYFTKFKFYQFGLAETGHEAIFPNPRLQVAIVGFLATWWTGIIIGFGIGLVALIHKDYEAMLRVVKKSILITLIITALSGITGLLYGAFYLTRVGVSWWLPDNLIDKNSFIMVGSMHNFSYLGGMIGLCVGIIYQISIARNNAIRKLRRKV